MIKRLFLLSLLFLAYVNATNLDSEVPIFDIHQGDEIIIPVVMPPGETQTLVKFSDVINSDARPCLYMGQSKSVKRTNDYATGDDVGIGQEVTLLTFKLDRFCQFFGTLDVLVSFPSRSKTINAPYRFTLNIKPDADMLIVTNIASLEINPVGSNEYYAELKKYVQNSKLSITYVEIRPAINVVNLNKKAVDGANSEWRVKLGGELLSETKYHYLDKYYVSFKSKFKSDKFSGFDLINFRYYPGKNSIDGVNAAVDELNNYISPKVALILGGRDVIPKRFFTKLNLGKVVQIESTSRFAAQYKPETRLEVDTVIFMKSLPVNYALDLKKLPVVARIEVNSVIEARDYLKKVNEKHTFTNPAFITGNPDVDWVDSATNKDAKRFILAFTGKTQCLLENNCYLATPYCYDSKVNEGKIKGECSEVETRKLFQNNNAYITLIHANILGLFMSPGIFAYYANLSKLIKKPFFLLGYQCSVINELDSRDESVTAPREVILSHIAAREGGTLVGNAGYMSNYFDLPIGTFTAYELVNVRRNQLNNLRFKVRNVPQVVSDQHKYEQLIAQGISGNPLATLTINDPT